MTNNRKLQPVETSTFLPSSSTNELIRNVVLCYTKCWRGIYNIFSRQVAPLQLIAVSWSEPTKRIRVIKGIHENVAKTMIYITQAIHYITLACAGQSASASSHLYIVGGPWIVNIRGNWGGL